MKAPGNCSVNIQLATPAVTPPAEPPVLTFSTWQTVAAAAGAWTPISFRIPARFGRVQFVDTSGAANNGIYSVVFLRGA